MAERTKLIIATTSAGKLREFRELLADLPVRLVSLADCAGFPVVDENGRTYADNALRKAVAIAAWCGGIVLADDSGLEVDALDGAPGVRSARYAGSKQRAQANMTKLLRALAHVPAARRTARFRCVIVVARPDGATLTSTGSCAGRILDAPRGTGGFGYDPLFWHPPSGCTFAEMPAAVKNRVSHRAVACRRLRTRLLEFVTTK